MQINDKKIKLHNIPLLLLLTCFCVSTTTKNVNISITYILIVFINSFISIYYILYSHEKSYSLGKLINLFVLVFFILANAIQHARNSVVLTFNISFSENDYIAFQFIVFCILLFYNSFYNFFISRIVIDKKTQSFNSNFNICKMLIVACVATILVLMHYKFNLYQLFFRGFSSDMAFEFNIQLSDEDSSVASDLIFAKVIRSIPWAVYVLSRCTNTPKTYRLFFFFLTLITVFPLGIARNAAAIYWLPISILLADKYIKGNRFVYLMFLGVLFIFPLMNNFRYFDGNIEFNFSLEYLDSMNMDASQIFMATVMHRVVTLGHQLLGSLLFFVPRSIWTAKPIGSGAFFIERMNGWFSNVSMPFFAEGYINYGYFGIFIFTFLLAYITGKIDGNFWRKHKPQIFTPSDGFYLVLLGAIMFIMRGDLMSSLAYTSGTCLSYYVTLVLSRKYK